MTGSFATGRQGGQALPEFLVAAVAIIPLFLLLPMLGKYQDMAHSTMLASRYVAFEAMTRNDILNSFKPEAEQARDVRRRFFSNSDAPIKTGDAAGSFEAHQNQFWRDPFGNRLVKSLDDDVTVHYGFSHGATHAEGFSGMSDGAPFDLKGNFKLSTKGLYTASVSVTIANLPDGLKFVEPFNKLNLSMTRSTSLLLDPWTGRDPHNVQDRLGNALINPASAGLFDPVKTVMNIAVQALDGKALGLGNITGPKLGELQYWRDVVPADRLK
ncbi:MAG: hypothetical protein HY836_11890 [Aquabacterium sp.]|uniref:hypothetical protein n=1 Tax=Aquabacterium sp. TaxID=1872578 RepID=UPI0025B7F7A9|nr:hypothetical protein [Aquabacterium sp.]MBI5926289.1 hypothetical protein [Aquabacterium sp.]